MPSRKLLIRAKTDPETGKTFVEMEARGYWTKVTLLPDGTPTAIAVEREEGVSSRDIRRLPMASIIQAAQATLAGARVPLWDSVSYEKTKRELLRALGQVKVPRGRPERGRSTKFYLELLESHAQLKAQGLKPAPEIARRKGVPLNTVHQWLFRARRLQQERGSE